TWFDRSPEPPLKHLPKGASHVEVRRVSRFYYCLTFRVSGVPHEDHRGGSPMSNGAGSLGAQELEAIRYAYDNREMAAVLREGFEGDYRARRAWLEALGQACDSQLADEGDVGRLRMSPQDRERCIIAILVGRGGGLTLAIHVYEAIALGVEVE